MPAKASKNSWSRRSVTTGAFTGLGLMAWDPAQAAAHGVGNPPVAPRDNLKITRLETLLKKSSRT